MPGSEINNRKICQGKEIKEEGKKVLGRKSFEQPMFIYKRLEELIPKDYFLRKVDKIIK